jgi:hypothetical protein
MATMADTSFQTQYREEFIATFEQHQSLLRDSTTTETVIRGNTATFLVAGSGGATAVTRGVHGLIPARPDDLTQTSATLAEWHDLVRKTNFNVFASQGNQRAIMQKTTMAVVNRKVDSDIITQLATGTNFAGATATTASLELALHALTVLGNNDVPFDGNVWAVITPGFLAYLMQTTEFNSADYVRKQPMDGDNPAWKDAPGFYEWMQIKWIVHPNLTGAGTSSEECYMYHSSAIGHAVDTAGMESPVGYNEEQGYSWARCSIHMGSKLLQNSGICLMRHDGSAFAATS